MSFSEKKTTIKDLAAILNVHHSTISRALGNHPDINPETKKRILDLAESLNYFPNQFARSLKTNKTNIIGVIVPEIKHYFFSDVISGIEEIAHKEGYALLLSQSNESCERERTNIEALVSNNIAGLLVSISQTTKDDSHFRLLQKYGIHIVFFDRVLENFEASKVIIDDYQCAYDATEFLLKKGYKRIAHLGGTKDLWISKNRFRGYKDALEYYNVRFNKSHVFFGGFQEENGIIGMQNLLSLTKRPDAVFAVNDPVAIGAYEVIKKSGLKIPEDIAVVGFSNNPISEIIDPPLTTVDQHGFEIGKQAAILLFEQIKNKSYENITKIVKSNLVIRSSV